MIYYGRSVDRKLPAISSRSRRAYLPRHSCLVDIYGTEVLGISGLPYHTIDILHITPPAQVAEGGGLGTSIHRRKLERDAEQHATCTWAQLYEACASCMLLLHPVPTSSLCIIIILFYNRTCCICNTAAFHADDLP